MTIGQRVASKLALIMQEVCEERARQIKKWGQQTLPNGTGDKFRFSSERYRRLTDKAAEQKSLTWMHVLREEFFEAIAEEDPGKLREELIQVMAVSAAWIADIDAKVGR